MFPAPICRSSTRSLAALLALAMLSFGAWAQEPVEDPPGRAARLSLIQGEVSLAQGDSEDWEEATLNRPLTRGDRLWVDDDGRAELQVGSSTVHLDRQTGFGFIELDDDVMQVSLTEGAASIRVRRLSDRQTIQVETPNATISLRHPGEYSFEVDREGDRTIVRTRSGEADVAGNSRSHRVRAGEQGTFTGLDDLQARIARAEPRNPFESWANDRERRAQRSQSGRYVSPDVVGYEDLDDHGEWVYEREYGHVWRPWVVSYDWAPYRYGHWVFIGPWGWTWVDDAPWGFAPFHYGRWARLHGRWCWVPGPRHLRPVYAPALVGWIGGPSVNISISIGSGIGWFPLAPREVYVPYYRHTPRYIRYVNVSNTVIINNTYITNVYHGREHPRYRHRELPDAVTAVHHDRFVGGRPIGVDRVRVNDRELREWRDHARPPELVGGSRNPKEHGDFRTDRQRVVGGEGKRGERTAPERDGPMTRGTRPVERRQEGDSPPSRSRDHMVRPQARDAQESGARERRRQEPIDRPPAQDTQSQRDARDRARAREWEQPAPQRQTSSASRRQELETREPRRHEPADRQPPREVREETRTREWAQPSPQRREEPVTLRSEPQMRAPRREEPVYRQPPAEVREAPRAREWAQPSPQRHAQPEPRRAESPPRQYSEPAPRSSQRYDSPRGGSGDQQPSSRHDPRTDRE